MCTHPLKEVVQLRSAETPWLPRRIAKNKEVATVENELEHLEKKLRAILNKVSRENVDQLMDNILELSLDSYDKLKLFVGLFFEQVNIVIVLYFKDNKAHKCRVWNKILYLSKFFKI
jgi:hypothetical protein